MRTLTHRANLARKRLRVLGIMSGTSLDGVDFALCSIGQNAPRLLQHWHTRFPKRLRLRLIEAARGRGSSHELGQLHHDLGRFYAEQARRLTGESNIELVGLHGQTVFHNPTKPRASLQLGEPAYLVEALRVPVISNFRAADLAAEGHGAPLATLFHRVVFGAEGAHVCVNNLGGISNVTSIDWRRSAVPKILAFDTGPANMPMDLAVQRLTRGARNFDRDGEWAQQGKPSESFLAAWLKHRYLRRRPPKSTGREAFGEPFVHAALREMSKSGLNRFDMIATLTEFTARSIALNYRLHLRSLPDRVVLCGGGAANEWLVRRIREQLSALRPNLEVKTSEDFGWPFETVEPAAFALLAFYRWNHRPGNIPVTTGAKREALLGQISEP